MTTTIVKIIDIALLIVGWIIGYWLGLRRTKMEQRNKISLDYYDKQLKELYGPIYSLLMKRQRLKKYLQEKLGRSMIFEEGKLKNKEEEELWMFYFGNYIHPIHSEIYSIIQNNTELINGDKFPQSFLNFIDYHVMIDFEYKRAKQQNIKNIFIQPPINFPSDLYDDIISTVSKLKQLQWQLVQKNNYK